MPCLSLENISFFFFFFLYVCYIQNTGGEQVWGIKGISVPKVLLKQSKKLFLKDKKQCNGLFEFSSCGNSSPGPSQEPRKHLLCRRSVGRSVLWWLALNSRHDTSPGQSGCLWQWWSATDARCPESLLGGEKHSAS